MASSLNMRGQTVFDDDGLGPMMRGIDGRIVTFVGTDDYQGELIDGGIESLMLWEETPTDYEQGITLLELGDVVDMERPQRLGMSFDGEEIGVYINGELEDTFPVGDVSTATAGLSSIACNGLPGCRFDYLFIGSEALDPAPDEWSSEVVADIAAEEPF